MLSKSYKIFFITLLIVGGLLFRSVNNVLALECASTCVSPQVCNTDLGECGDPDADDTEAEAEADPGPSVTMENPSNIESVQDLFDKLVDFIIPLALLFAGVMIIWSGFLFVTAQGDPTAITKAKQNFIWTITGVAIVLASKAIVDYVSGLMGGSGTTGEGEALVTTITNLLKNQIIPLMFVLVTVYFFWGIITYVRAAGDQKAIDTGKQHMIWGIIGMAVMASAWGIVEMIRVSVM